MKLNNNGEAFVISWNGEDHIIEKGKSKITNDDFARFVTLKVKKWGLPVEFIDNGTANVIEQIKTTPNKTTPNKGTHTKQTPVKTTTSK